MHLNRRSAFWNHDIEDRGSICLLVSASRTISFFEHGDFGGKRLIVDALPAVPRPFRRRHRPQPPRWQPRIGISWLRLRDRRARRVTRSRPTVGVLCRADAGRRERMRRVLAISAARRNALRGPGCRSGVLSRRGRGPAGSPERHRLRREDRHHGGDSGGDRCRPSSRRIRWPRGAAGRNLRHLEDTDRARGGGDDPSGPRRPNDQPPVAWWSWGHLRSGSIAPAAYGSRTSRSHRLPAWRPQFASRTVNGM
jgi:hypothetical protein